MHDFQPGKKLIFEAAEEIAGRPGKVTRVDMLYWALMYVCLLVSILLRGRILVRFWSLYEVLRDEACFAGEWYTHRLDKEPEQQPKVILAREKLELPNGNMMELWQHLDSDAGILGGAMASEPQHCGGCCGRPRSPG